MTPFDQRRREARERDKLARDENMREQYRRWREFLADAKKKAAARALQHARTPNLWSN